MIDRIKNWISKQSRNKDLRSQVRDAATSSKMAAIFYLAFSLIGGVPIGLFVDRMLGFAFASLGIGLFTAFIISYLELDTILYDTEVKEE